MKYSGGKIEHEKGLKNGKCRMKRIVYKREQVKSSFLGDSSSR